MTTTRSIDRPAIGARLLAVTLLCAVVALAVLFAAPRFTSGPNDPPLVVKDRLFERDASYQWSEMAMWARQSPDEAARYVMPVLFPIDLLFMLALAGLTAAGSSVLAAGGRVRAVPAWVWFSVPAIYLLCDAAEDVALAALMSSPDRITAASVTAVQWVTRIKIATALLCFVQLAALSLFVLARGEQRSTDAACS